MKLTMYTAMGLSLALGFLVGLISEFQETTCLILIYTGSVALIAMGSLAITRKVCERLDKQ